LSGPSADIEPPTADEVIREIDDIMEVCPIFCNLILIVNH